MITPQQVLLGIQGLLDDPNVASAANAEACGMFQKDHVAYERGVRGLAAGGALGEA